MLVLRGKTIAVISVLFVAAFAAIIVLACALCPNYAYVAFNTKFYYLCYDCPSDAVSASSVSSLVYSQGGAGYVVESGGRYYSVVSCYYSEADAESVNKKLNGDGILCEVLEVSAGGYKVEGGKAEAKICAGALNEMLSLSKVCYELANSLDKYECDQRNALSVMENVRDLAVDLKEERGGYFAEKLTKIVEYCEEIISGYVISRDVRYVQVQFCDAIVNADF